MTITEFMKEYRYGAELRFGNGRLWYGNVQGQSVVCLDEYRKRKKIVLRTESEEEAVAKAVELTEL